MELTKKEIEKLLIMCFLHGRETTTIKQKLKTMLTQLEKKK